MHIQHAFVMELVTVSVSGEFEFHTPPICPPGFNAFPNNMYIRTYNNHDIHIHGGEKKFHVVAKKPRHRLDLVFEDVRASLQNAKLPVPPKLTVDYLIAIYKCDIINPVFAEPAEDSYLSMEECDGVIQFRYGNGTCTIRNGLWRFMLQKSVEEVETFIALLHSMIVCTLPSCDDEL